jgi:hypothetical protein
MRSYSYMHVMSQFISILQNICSTLRVTCNLKCLNPLNLVFPNAFLSSLKLNIFQHFLVTCLADITRQKIRPASVLNHVGWLSHKCGFLRNETNPRALYSLFLILLTTKNRQY